MVPPDPGKLAPDSSFGRSPRMEGRRSASVLENTPEMLTLIDANGIILYINAQTETILGFHREEVVGQNIFEFVHPEDVPRAAHEYSNTLQFEGERVPTVLRLRNAEGGWVPVETIANNQLKNPDVQAVIFAARDLRYRQEIQEALRGLNEDFRLGVADRVTELARMNVELRIENQARKKAESELQRSVSLLNASLDSTADGLLVVATDGKVTSCNNKFMEMWRIEGNCPAGLNDDALLGQVLEQLQSPEEFVSKVKTLYAEPAASSFDVLHFKDGRIFERYSQPQKVGSKIVGRVWSFRDVTRARNLELELRQAQKMEALGRLAGGVAHDFNNLLMLISGYVSQLTENEISEGNKSICDQILATTKRAAAVTRQLLAFSRKLPDSPRVTDLNAIVIDLEPMLRRLLSEQIQMRIEVGKEPRPVLVDVSQIELMLLNLAINAQDAMPNGGVLSIRVGHELLPVGDQGSRVLNSFAMVEVKDTGHGMIPEVKAHIFEPFFTTKQLGKGTGLGLSTVFGIVERAGGHVEVQSEPDVGTTFQVYLPEVPEAPTPAATESYLPNPGRGSETILLAEDEDGIRAMTRAYLESLGYRVIEAADGDEAVRLASEFIGSIELVLTDILMPGRRGDVVVQEIRTKRPNAKALFMSGYTEEDVRVEGEDVLYKPFSFPELGRRIRSLLGPPSF